MYKIQENINFLEGIEISGVDIINNEFRFKNNEYQNIYSSFNSMIRFKIYPIMNKSISKELFENGFLGDFQIIGNYEFIIKIN